MSAAPAPADVPGQGITPIMREHSTAIGSVHIAPDGGCGCDCADCVDNLDNCICEVCSGECGMGDSHDDRRT